MCSVKSVTLQVKLIIVCSTGSQIVRYQTDYSHEFHFTVKDMAARSMPFSDTELQLDAPPPYSATDPAASCAPAVTSSQLGRPPQYGSVNAARPYQPYGIAPQWSQCYNATLTPPVATQPLLAPRQQPPAVQVQCEYLIVYSIHFCICS